jgi:hypothetical protein
MSVEFGKLQSQVAQLASDKATLANEKADIQRKYFELSRECARRGIRCGPCERYMHHIKCEVELGAMEQDQKHSG